MPRRRDRRLQGRLRLRSGHDALHQDCADADTADTSSAITSSTDAGSANTSPANASAANTDADAQSDARADASADAKGATTVQEVHADGGHEVVLQAGWFARRCMRRGQRGVERL